MAFALVAGCLSVSPLEALAQWVRVRAHTEVWLELTDAGCLAGWLADDRGVRLPGRTLHVHVGDGPALSQRTDASGAYRMCPAILPGEVRLRATFAGDPYHEPTTVERLVDPGRAQVLLELLPPTQISMGARVAEIQARAERGGEPVALPVSIRLEGGTELGSLQTDSTGWGHGTVEVARLGGPGRVVLRARFAGDATQAPSDAHAATLLVDRTSLTLEAADAQVHSAARLRLAGLLRGVRGPLPGEVVLLESTDGEIGSARTESDGRFSLVVDASALGGAGAREVVALFESSGSTRTSARSDPVSVTVLSPRPLTLLEVGVPALLTVLLVSFVLTLTRRRGDGGGAAVATPSDRPATSGLQPPGPAGRRSRVRDRWSLSGQVWDPVESRPVARALLVARLPGTVREARSDALGRFSMEGLPAGVHEVVVDAKGYVPERFATTIPHDGSGDELRVHLVQVRHRALEAYRAAVVPLLPRPTLWGHWTPREVAVDAVRNRPWLADPVAELTSRFEEAYYSGVMGTTVDLDGVRAVADAVRRGNEMASARRVNG